MFDFLLTVVLLGGARLARRMIAERPDRATRRRRTRGVLVVGAGSGGQMVVRELRLNPNLGARAIGFVDDDPRKRGMHAVGMKVLGSTDEIGEILDRTSPDEVVIAIPSAPGVLRAKVVAACRERDIPVRTLPTVFELLRGGVQLTRQLREVRVEDVLGRDPVVMELDRVGAYLEDKIVLVTGAGGSIGAELCRQIARVRPKLLVLLDHAEDNLFRIDREMLDEWHFTRVEAVLADCKEGERMLEVMQRFKPDIVFHAAAYKHVPLMEANPARGGAQQRDRHPRDGGARPRPPGAERFVLISTDKAVNPRTVMGASKAMAEWIVEAAGQRHHDTRFIIVRFGNVLASSGSVVPIFRSQIEKGGPVTVTHPEMTRYFMTIPEAVQLVIQAGDLGGEVRRRLRARDGRAGADPRSCSQHDSPGRISSPTRTWRSSSSAPARARRSTRSCSTSTSARSRRVRSASSGPCATRPLDPAGWSARSSGSRRLVAGGDEAGLADRVVEVVTERISDSTAAATESPASGTDAPR